MSRPWVTWAAAGAILVGAVVARTMWSSRQELAAGREARGADDEAGAVMHFRQAAHWYTPGNPYVTEALAELRSVARQAEIEGRHGDALAAYRAIRSSCLATRSLYLPHQGRFHEANRRIADLMARQERPPMDRGKTVARLREEHLALLEHVEEPHPAWAVIACLGFLLWIGGTLKFIYRGLDEKLRVHRKRALPWAVAVATGLALWIAGLVLA